MTKQIVSIALSAILLTSPLAAAPREVVRTDWNGLQEQVSARRLTGRQVRISLTGGREIKTELLNLVDDGLVAPSGRNTKQWGTKGKQVTIPKDQIVSLQFERTVGRGRAIGTIAGAGTGAAISAAVLAGHDVSEGPLAILIPAGAAAIIGIGALIGYGAGATRDHHVTEFVLTK
jgi:hypothetical protein